MLLVCYCIDALTTCSLNTAYFGDYSELLWQNIPPTLEQVLCTSMLSMKEEVPESTVTTCHVSSCVEAHAAQYVCVYVCMYVCVHVCMFTYLLVHACMYAGRYVGRMAARLIRA